MFSASKEALSLQCSGIVFFPFGTITSFPLVIQEALFTYQEKTRASHSPCDIFWLLPELLITATF